MNERDAERERKAAQYEDAVEAGAVTPLPEGVQYPGEVPRKLSISFGYDDDGGVVVTGVEPDPTFGTVKVPQEEER